MKKIFIIFNLLSLTMLAQSALADKPAIVKSELTHIVTDSELGVGPNAGHVIFNYIQNTISLTINFKGSPCPAVMQPPLRVELPVVSAGEGHCGAKIFVAEENLMPVDGTFQNITVSDNTINYCFTDEYVAPVTGEYSQQYLSRENGELITLKASFEGRPFRKLSL